MLNLALRGSGILEEFKMREVAQGGVATEFGGCGCGEDYRVRSSPPWLECVRTKCFEKNRVFQLERGGVWVQWRVQIMVLESINLCFRRSL